MNKKGFTLIELLAVITLLTIILTITFSVVTNVLENSRTNTYDSQISTIENAAKRYISDNIQALNDDGTNKISTVYDNFVTIQTLQKEGYLNSKEVLKNPKTDRTMTGCVIAAYAHSYKQFQYVYTDYNCLNTDENKSLTPKITFTSLTGGNYTAQIKFPSNASFTYIYTINNVDKSVMAGSAVTETVTSGTKITAKVLRGEDVVRQITEIA